MDATDSLRGRLLVAEPTMLDPNFARAVVLIVEHEHQGAAGLVLNRPTELDVAEVMPEQAPLAAEPAVVFFGGPVAPEAAVCLASVRTPIDGWEPLVGGVGVLDLSLDLEEVAPSVVSARLFAGYAGWSEGQLESELEQDAWFVVEATPDDLLGAEPGTLWRRVLKRQGGTLAMVAHFPVEPSLN